MKLKIVVTLIIFLSVLLTSCLPSSPTSKGKRTITVFAFSVMKESLEKEIYPSFMEKWRKETGEEVEFTSSFAGSETIVNQIQQGAPADIGIFSIERDVDRLITSGHVPSDWYVTPQKGIANKTPFVILVRKDNPKGIMDFPDLAKEGVKIIHPDPVSSGGAQWSILSIYGSELLKSEKNGAKDEAKALETLKGIWKNVISTPGSAREARTQFETGFGDALITYELEGLLMKQANAPIEIVVPKSTIFSEHPVTIIDKNVTSEERSVVQAFRNFLWTEEAQKIFVKYYFRSTTDEKLNENNPQFAKIELPFTVQQFGGWVKAYPDVIENIFQKQVIPSKK